MTARTFRVHDASRELSLSFYSPTWDVVSFDDGETDSDDCVARIVATFANRDAASAHASTLGYALVRPPSTVIGDALAWLRYVTELRYSEGVTLQHARAHI